MAGKIEQLEARLKELAGELSQPAILEDQARYKQLAQEYTRLMQITELSSKLSQAEQDLFSYQTMLKEEKESEMVQLVEEAIKEEQHQIEELTTKLNFLLVPPDPNDSKTTILELRAATGGKEAALFVADCARMYQNFAHCKNWTVEPLSLSPSDLGGFKEYIMAISGKDVYRYLQYEAGTHRVQRIPETETQGRIHTSTITIAVLVEPDKDEEIQIEDKELRIDTYRASGAGGQHINTTDSAVRITHLPTGIVCYCMEERSQHKNKEKALRLLKAKINDAIQKEAESQRAQLRSSQIGSGERSERIRTYNFPQNRITEHRLNLTKYNLDEVINGELEEITSALIRAFVAKGQELS